MIAIVQQNVNPPPLMSGGFFMLMSFLMDSLTNNCAAIEGEVADCSGMGGLLLEAAVDNLDLQRCGSTHQTNAVEVHVVIHAGLFLLTV